MNKGDWSDFGETTGSENGCGGELDIQGARKNLSYVCCGSGGGPGKGRLISEIARKCEGSWNTVGSGGSRNSQMNLELLGFLSLNEREREFVWFLIGNRKGILVIWVESDADVISDIIKGEILNLISMADPNILSPLFRIFPF